ncbi:hypothetical protein [Pseudomonas sp. Marseille-Q5115]|uniref:hypothetical protein n=1 Tax=Pseudomonas sp. Marseille-Q5115 TaxID=2866593 RepID=UPI001CE48A30|nr:hypothetical protein [Pseudomonas sp. Marseille-Q5115]
MTEPSSSTTYQKLQRASELLCTAAALASETTDADLTLCRAVNQAVIVLTDTSRALLEDVMQDIDSNR